MSTGTEKRKTSKKHVILASWAGVTTALLLVLLIGGAFYAVGLKSRERKVHVPVTLAYMMLE